MDKEYIKLLETRSDLFINPDDAPIQVVTDLDLIHTIEQNTNTTVGVMYHDQYLYLLRDVVQFADKSYGTYVRFIEEANADCSTVILPLISNDIVESHILLTKHFRHATRDFMWELPRGFGTPTCTSEHNAFKELRDETCIVPTSMEFLGYVHQDSGLFQKKVAIYLAECEQDAILQQNHEGIVGYEIVTTYELYKLIRNGTITDSFTLSAAMLMVARNWQH